MTQRRMCKSACERPQSAASRRSPAPNRGSIRPPRLQKIGTPPFAPSFHMPWPGRQSRPGHTDSLTAILPQKRRISQTGNMQKADSFRCPPLCRHYLFSRSVSRQVSSAQMSLTSMFGMGTGGPSSQATPTHFSLKRKVSKRNFKTFFSLPFSSTISFNFQRGSSRSAQRALLEDWCAFTDSNRGPTD